jgi:hypothetical protein
MDDHLPLPTTAAALLEAAENLSYSQRFRLASRIGNEVKDSNVLSTLIADLTAV